MDFFTNQYIRLLKTLKTQGFLFHTVSQYLKTNISSSTFIILRHDVEARYENALRFATLQGSFEITGTYYFRISPGHFNSEIIKKISDLGHDIGYHYDDLSFCKGNYDTAMQRFEKNLEIIRQIAPVNTITMEGDPLSKYDNRDLWKIYDYHDFGLTIEPYFDINFDEVFYLTDTGRCWDGWKFSVRDKMPQQEEWIRKGLVFHSTNDIIKAAEAGKLPDKIMMTFHPQRWTDRPLPWLKELVWQNVKNVGKFLIVKSKE